MNWSILKKFYHYPRFIAVGIFGVLLNILTTWTLTKFLAIWYLPAFMVATLLTWTAGFWLNWAWTFRGHTETDVYAAYRRHLGWYSFLSAPAFILTYVLVSILGINYLLSVAVINLFMSVVSFLASKNLVFRYDL